MKLQQQEFPLMRRRRKRGEDKKLMNLKSRSGSNKLGAGSKLSEISHQTLNGVKCRIEWPVTKTEAMTSNFTMFRKNNGISYLQEFPLMYVQTLK